MDNFTNTPLGYDKKEVNDFVDYVIKKTQDNIITIKKQKDEIEFLKRENERLKKLEDSYTYIQTQIENVSSEIKSNAKYEAELIIKEAKDNASAIVNDALLKTAKINNEREILGSRVHAVKKKVKNAIKEQLDIIDEIEML